MKIMISGRNSTRNFGAGDPLSLFSAAQRLGIEVVSSLDEAPDVLICVDYARVDLNVVRQARKRAIWTVLVIQEPQVVLPQHSKSSILGRFDSVLRVGRPDGEPQLKWPQIWRALSKNPNRLQCGVLINSDKWSFVRGHLYWLRVAVASTEQNLVVFGYGWDRPSTFRLSRRLFELLRILSTLSTPTLKGLRYVLSRPLCYLGETTDKVTQMSNYAVAVVIENSREFLSEKLFDAWFAGCVPVYVGPSLEKMGLPSELVIESNPDIRSLQDAIEQAYLVDRHTFHNELEKFLATKQALEWKSEIALEKILKAAIAPSSAMRSSRQKLGRPQAIQNLE